MHYVYYNDGEANEVKAKKVTAYEGANGMVFKNQKHATASLMVDLINKRWLSLPWTNGAADLSAVLNTTKSDVMILSSMVELVDLLNEIDDDEKKAREAAGEAVAAKVAEKAAGEGKPDDLQHAAALK